jgi:hypothetical protein
LNMVCSQDMIFSFLILLTMIILIDRFKKKYNKLEWGF